MATFIQWNGTNGDLDAAANYTGGVAPATNESVLFNYGSQSVDTDMGGLATLDELHIYPGYTGTIGGSGNELTSSINTIKHLGVAEAWLEDAAGTTDNVFIRCATRNTIVHLNGSLMTNVYLLRGTVVIDAGATITNLYIGYVENVETDVTCTITAGATLSTQLQMWGGRITVPITIPTTYMRAGYMDVTLGSSGTLTTLYQTGGYINHDAATGITTATIGPGTLDLGDSAKTVATLYQMPGAVVLKQDALHTITAEYDLTSGA